VGDHTTTTRGAERLTTSAGDSVTELLARDVLESTGFRVAGTARPATLADLVAYLAAQPDGGDALLRELLRADPDRAVRVVAWVTP